jgi:hypothetical protein
MEPQLDKPGQMSILMEGPMQESSTTSLSHKDFVAKIQKKIQTFEREAWFVKELMTSATLQACSKFSKHVTDLGFKCYRDQFLAAAGNPTDPVECMLLEQLLMAHHQISGLYGETADVSAPEGKELIHAAAARLLGEFRRTALALKEYRNAASLKQLTVVGQQNVASGNQQIAYLGGKAAPPPAWTAEKTADIKMENKQEVLSYEPQTVSIPQFQTRGGRETEPSLAWSDDAGAARAASSSGSADPTVGTCNRAQNVHGEGPLRPQRQKASEGTELGA